tara:strand:+ start:202 stop:1218 length:1017 start_codon:yes stop_codon:yes gene_type:complete
MYIKNLINSSILITGGTGSFGQAMTHYLCNNIKKIKRLVIYSRDELKQYKMAQKFPESKYPFIRFFLGDVRDEKRLQRALNGIDIIIHAAALKQVPAAEYNPFEFINTNVIGAQNIIEASLNSKVKKVVALSTDKASSPINLYGATKLCSDKLFVSANNYVGKKKLSFSVVRYGNVMGSRGSVIPHFLKQKESGTLKITNKNMTRFNISLKESVDLVVWAIKNSFGSEIIIPKIPSYRIIDLAKSISNNCKIKIIGKRVGEKIHEEMISLEESINAMSLKDRYVILQSFNSQQKKYYSKKFKGKIIEKQFSYNSGTNPNFLTVTNLRKLIKKNNIIKE